MKKCLVGYFFFAKIYILLAVHHSAPKVRSFYRQGLEDRLSKHVDVREALLKKKDEQLQSK